MQCKKKTVFPQTKQDCLNKFLIKCYNAVALYSFGLLFLISAVSHNLAEMPLNPEPDKFYRARDAGQSCVENEIAPWCHASANDRGQPALETRHRYEATAQRIFQNCFSDYLGLCQSTSIRDQLCLLRFVEVLLGVAGCVCNLSIIR